MGIELDGANHKLKLDNDGDTYLEANTDDIIKYYVAGAEDLRIGANAINVLSGTTLTIDSGATITNSGTANGFGGGKILQVVQTVNNTEQSTTSTSMQNSNAAVTITPSATSSKILLLGAIPCGSYKTSGSASTAAHIDMALFRGDNTGTELTYAENAFSYTASSSGTTYSLSGSYAICYLDSPSTTSSQTYTVCYASLGSGWTAYMQWCLSGTDAESTLTALEIGA
jgi:hypothetical protein